MTMSQHWRLEKTGWMNSLCLHFTCSTSGQKHLVQIRSHSACMCAICSAAAAQPFSANPSSVDLRVEGWKHGFCFKPRAFFLLSYVCSLVTKYSATFNDTGKRTTEKNYKQNKDGQNEKLKNTGNMWDPKHNIVGTKEKNRMEHAHIENGRRSTSKKST